jgi:hyperosmotically inducible protein
MICSQIYPLKRAVICITFFLAGLFFFTFGCTPFWLGAGAAGGYIIASDERSMGQRVDDSFITAKVKSRLLADSMVKGFKIDVDTLEREVTLTGIVSTTTEAERAIELARGVRGVVKVKNNIKVKH